MTETQQVFLKIAERTGIRIEANGTALAIEVDGGFQIHVEDDVERGWFHLISVVGELPEDQRCTSVLQLLLQANHPAGDFEGFHFSIDGETGQIILSRSFRREAPQVDEVAAAFDLLLVAAARCSEQLEQFKDTLLTGAEPEIIQAFDISIRV